MPLSPRTLRPANNAFTPRSISGLALWLDAADSSTTYTTDAGPVTAVSAPTDISGCVGWYDSADLSAMKQNSDGTGGVAAGDPVGYWADKSSTGAHVTATGTARPTLSATGFNSKQALVFNGSSTNLSRANYTATNSLSGLTRIAVCGHTTNTVAAMSRVYDGGSDFFAYMNASFRSYADAASGVSASINGSSSICPSGVYASVFSSGSHSIYSSGSLPTITVLSPIPSTTGGGTPSLYIGSNAGVNFFWNGPIAEYIIFNRALTRAELARVEAYLATKWGISQVHAPATATSDPVGYWGDKSGNARHFAQTTGASRPVIASVRQNGRPQVTFDGSDDRLIANIGSAFPSAAELFVVMNNMGDTAYEVYGTRSAQNPQSNAGFGGLTFPGTFRVDRTSGSQTFLTYGDRTFLWNVRSSASAYNLALDSLVQFSDAANFAGGDTHVIGASNTAATVNQSLAGRVLEVVAYPRILSTSERSRLERYLAAKWGIALPPTVSNADAQDWINRVYANGSTVSASTAAAVSAFCDAIDAASIRDRFYRLNLFCGGVSQTTAGLNACLVPLYRGQSLAGTQYGNTTDTNNAFATTDYSEASGLGPQATSSTTKYLDTGFAASSLPTTRSFGVFIPAPTYTGNNLYSYLGSAAANGTNMIAMPIRDGGVVATDSSSGSYNVTSVTYTLASGHYINNTPSGSFSLRKTLRNGSVIGTGADSAATLGSQSIFVMATNLGGSVSSRSPNGIYGYHFGPDMTATQAEALRAAFNTFATAIGRPNV